MSISTTILLLLIFPLIDGARFPVCITDEDCTAISVQADAKYSCFQYRCFPWEDTELQGNFRTCRTREDCLQLEEEEEGEGLDGECIRHQNMKIIHRGFCVSKRFA